MKVTVKKTPRATGTALHCLLACEIQLVIAPIFFHFTVMRTPFRTPNSLGAVCRLSLASLLCAVVPAQAAVPTAPDDAKESAPNAAPTTTTAVQDESRFSQPLPLPDEMDEDEADENFTNDTPRPNAPRASNKPRVEETAQRRQQREQRELGLRRLMVTFGVDEHEAQDEVMDFIARETRARAQVKRQSTRLYALVSTPNAGNDEIADALSDYRTALANERERRAQSEDALNARIGFRNQPRLEAFLALSGLIGDGPLALPLNTRQRPAVENRALASKRPAPMMPPVAPKVNR